MTTPPPGPDVMCIGQARMTAGLDRVERIDLTTHYQVFGSLPRLTADQLIGMAEQVDLRGRGGAAFPVARKVKSVLESARKRKRRTVVLVNGTEGEPGAPRTGCSCCGRPTWCSAGRWSRPGPCRPRRS